MASINHEQCPSFFACYFKCSLYRKTLFVNIFQFNVVFQKSLFFYITVRISDLPTLKILPIFFVRKVAVWLHSHASSWRKCDVFWCQCHCFWQSVTVLLISLPGRALHMIDTDGVFQPQRATEGKQLIESHRLSASKQWAGIREKGQIWSPNLQLVLP